MKAPGKHNRATAAHIPDGISERDGFAGQVHREFFVQSSKIASWPPSTPSTGSPSSTLGGTNSMRRFEFRRTGFPRDESWLRPPVVLGPRACREGGEQSAPIASPSTLCESRLTSIFQP